MEEAYCFITTVSAKPLLRVNYVWYNRIGGGREGRKRRKRNTKEEEEEEEEKNEEEMEEKEENGE